MAKKVETKEQLANKQSKAEALKLVRDTSFLHRAAKKIVGLGVVGERRNGIILFLAGLTKDSDSPVSHRHMERGLSPGRSFIYSNIVEGRTPNTFCVCSNQKKPSRTNTQPSKVRSEERK